MSKVCKFCGAENIPANMAGYCQPCYKYFHTDKKTIYPIPPHGVMYHTETGDVVCPLCGKAFRKLGGHLVQAHHITTKEAYPKFGWYRNAKATNAEYQEHMRNVQHPKALDNLSIHGVPTRYGVTHACGGRPKGVKHMRVENLKDKR